MGYVMNNLFKPFLSEKERLLELKKYMISKHHDFCCPITGQIMDYRRVHIVKLKNPTKKIEEYPTLVSVDGYNSLTDYQKDKLKIIERIDDL